MILPAVIAAIRDVGGLVVDDIDGRVGRAPPSAGGTFTLTLTRSVDADGVLLATGRLGGELRVNAAFDLRGGRAHAEHRAAEVCHRLVVALPELAIEEVLSPPPPRRNTRDPITARARLRLLAPGPVTDIEHVAEAAEAIRTAGLALMMPTGDVDEVTLPSSLEVRALTDTLGLVEADLALRLDPLRPHIYRAAHAAIVAALRGAGRRVDDDGSGRVAPLADQRDPAAADVRLVSYAGWQIGGAAAVEAVARFPVIF